MSEIALAVLFSWMQNQNTHFNLEIPFSKKFVDF
jgi:hypothetical protein